MSGSPTDDNHPGDSVPRSVTLDLEAFAWAALEDESAEQGVLIDELVRFSVLYYLADRDSGRIARRLPTPESLGSSNPLEKLLGD